MKVTIYSLSRIEIDPDEETTELLGHALREEDFSEIDDLLDTHLNATPEYIAVFDDDGDKSWYEIGSSNLDSAREMAEEFTNVMRHLLGPEGCANKEEPAIYHHYFPGDGKSFGDDYDPASLRTGCGVPIERGHVMPELNDVTCEACLEAYSRSWHRHEGSQADE